MSLKKQANDTRIKVVATLAMYDMPKSISDHDLGDYSMPEQRELVRHHLAKHSRLPGVGRGRGWQSAGSFILR